MVHAVDQHQSETKRYVLQVVKVGAQLRHTWRLKTLSSARSKGKTKTSSAAARRARSISRIFFCASLRFFCMFSVNSARFTGGTPGVRNSWRRLEPMGGRGSGTPSAQVCRRMPRRKIRVLSCAKQYSRAQSRATAQWNSGTSSCKMVTTLPKKLISSPFCLCVMPTTFSRTHARRSPALTRATQVRTTAKKAPALWSFAANFFPPPAHGGHGGPEQSKCTDRFQRVSGTAATSPSDFPKCKWQSESVSRRYGPYLFSTSKMLHALKGTPKCFRAHPAPSIPTHGKAMCIGRASLSRGRSSGQLFGSEGASEAA